MQSGNDIQAMRDHGRDLTEQGFIEINLISGNIAWANEFALKKYGYDLKQIQKVTIFDVVPEEFQDDISSIISDQTRGKFHRFSVIPGKTAGGKLVWWYITLFKKQNPLYWFKIEFMCTTDVSGPEYTSMVASMEVANGYNELYNKISDFSEWTKENIIKLENEVTGTRESIDEMKEQMKSCLAAANRAANLTLENVSMINSLKGDITKELSNYTAEILRLITTDSVHSQQMKAFEEHVKATFETHMKETTNQAVMTIQIQAEKSGKGLAKKITIPISAIAFIATVVQWALTNWSSLPKW